MTSIGLKSSLLNAYDTSLSTVDNIFSQPVFYYYVIHFWLHFNITYIANIYNDL